MTNAWMLTNAERRSHKTGMGLWEQGWRSGEALTSHQCGPGSIPGLGVICGLSLLLVLVLSSERFFSGYSGFPLSSKTNTSKFQFDLESVPN